MKYYIFMKILATSDMHGNLEGLSLDGIDVALLAGDIAPLHGFSVWHVHDQLKWMNQKFSNWCSKWPSCKVVFIPGNHDLFPIAKCKFNRPDINFSLHLPDNAYMLIDQEIDINGLKIYGTPWVPIISYRWAFEADHQTLASKFNAIPENLDILLTHAAPRHSMLDISLENGIDSIKFGSGELTEAVISKKPKIMVCGHIHSGLHKTMKLGETDVRNVSRVNESYDAAYEPWIFDIGDIA